MAARSIPGEAARYLTVVSLGLALDIGLAWGLVRTGLPDAFAAALSLAAVLVLSYHAHRTWTFASGAGGSAGFARYVGVAAVVWMVRAGALGLLSGPLPGDGWQAPLRLAMAACASFPVGFALSRALAFTSR